MKPSDVKQYEDRYDDIRAQWKAAPTPKNARRLDRARTAVHTARTIAASREQP